MEIPFFGKFCPKHQNCHFKLKFGTYTNSNMQNSMAMFIFFVFDRKYLFWANLVQKVKIISWSWNLVARLIRICIIQWCCSPFWFLSGNDFLEQIWSKKSKLSLYAQILVPTLIRICRTHWCDSLFCFWLEIPFLGKFGPKSQNSRFKLKFGTYTNSNMQNSMVMFKFFVLIENTLFGQIWSKKSKLSVEAEIW